MSPTEKPRTLVVYYSRSGNTRRVAEEIATVIGAELEEIIEDTRRSGLLGYLRSGRDALLHRLPAIGRSKHDPAKFDLVIIGTPVWTSSVAAPVRTWLVQNAHTLGRVAFFVTHGGSGSKRTFRQMEQLGEVEPVATLAVREHELKTGEWLPPTQQFAAAFSWLPAPELTST